MRRQCKGWRRRGSTFSWVLCGSLLLSCKAAEEPPGPKAPSESRRRQGASETPPPRYETVGVSPAGSIRGRVRLAGDVSAPEDITIHKDREVCGTSTPNPSLHFGPGGTVEDAVVFLVGVSRGKALRPLDRVAEIEVVKCRLVPHVLVVPAGTTLELVNSDPLLHDIEGTFERDSEPFELILPIQHFRARRKLERPGRLRLASAIGYSWMRAYVFVQEHPYYARTDDRGSFVIEEIPPGTYRLSVWHEWLGEQGRAVTVEPGAMVDVLFELSVPEPGQAQ